MHCSELIIYFSFLILRAQCLCYDDSQCSVYLPHCDTIAYKCVVCMNNTQCTSSSAPYCNTTSNTCQFCLTNSECPVSGTYCQPGGASCGPCASNGECSGSTPYCNRAIGGICTKCIQNSECSGQTPYCNPVTHTCTECVDNSECVSALTPYCNITSGTCQACVINSECKTGLNNSCYNGNCVECPGQAPYGCKSTLPVCNMTSLTCQGCTMDSECPAALPYCNVEYGNCEQCRVQTSPNVQQLNCENPTPTCSKGACVACTSNLGCNTTTFGTTCNATSGLCINAADQTSYKARIITLAVFVSLLVAVGLLIIGKLSLKYAKNWKKINSKEAVGAPVENNALQIQSDSEPKNRV